jgi:hypothetical protein
MIYTYTPEQITEIVRLHGLWWRDEAGGVRANLRGANLSDANLSGANLRGANLRGANLRGANLSDADLSGANLIGANLRGANLSDANLRGANLIGANLRGANLSDADLRGANLSDALQRIVVIHGSRNVIVAIDGDVRIGCERHVIAEWLEQFEAIGQKQGYTPEQIAEYGLHLRHIAAVLALGWPAGAKAEFEAERNRPKLGA